MTALVNRKRIMNQATMSEILHPTTCCMVLCVRESSGNSSMSLAVAHGSGDGQGWL